MSRTFPDGSRHGFTPGDLFAARYRLQELIGEGGMGRVFRAEQRSLGRSVAVKFLRPSLADDEHMLRRFHNEVRAASMLSHPNLVSVIDFGVTVPGGPFLVMEYVRGTSLSRILDSEGPLSLRRAAGLVGQILSALETAHGAGVVHADIKSENILVEGGERGEEERVKIIDFGLARLGGPAEADLGGDEMLSGTPEYLAPEVILSREPTALADLYAAGVIFFELLTGATPFAGGTPQEILNRQLTDVIVPPSLRRPDRLIPPGLERVVVKALDKAPDGRFASAAAFRAALAAATDEMGVDAVGRCQSCDQSRPVDICACPLCGSATGDRRPVQARCESTTHNWGPKSADPRASAYLQAIARAMERGSPDAIADGYLDLARLLVRSGQIANAIAELEEAIDVVGRGHPSEMTEPAPQVSRLLAGLAGLHGLRGDRSRARHAAILSHRAARRTR